MGIATRGDHFEGRKHLFLLADFVQCCASSFVLLDIFMRLSRALNVERHGAGASMISGQAMEHIELVRVGLGFVSQEKLILLCCPQLLMIVVKHRTRLGTFAS